MAKVIKSEDFKGLKEAMDKHCKNLESIVEMCVEANALLTRINTIGKDYGIEISIVEKNIEHGEAN